jgi:3-isopropylmalate/(R)-2-methylmalate dehydratase large subunit
MATPRTLFEKVWQRHLIAQRSGQCLLYVDRQYLHDGSIHAFNGLAARGLKVRRPSQTFGMPDHYVPTTGRSAADAPTAEIRFMVENFARNVERHGIAAFALDDARQGIVHVVGPEQGMTQPGSLIVCGDSHTSTHGALGALAFGVGQSENEHVLATQALWQAPQKTLRVRVEGRRPRGVSAKDVILAVIGRIGVGGAVRHVIEYAGAAIRAMSIEERLTVCNMSIEAGARAGMVAPDDATYQYLAGKPHAPQGTRWDEALRYWKTLPSDPEASFDAEVSLDADALEPMVTWGTNPGHVLPVSGAVPAGEARALEYMGLRPGMRLEGLPVDRVFIGSCTNSRIEDLRAAAAVVRGRKARVPAMVVPGSGLVKRQAEAEGLDRVFREAGFEWRHAGCSMCVGMNGDLGRPQERIASTSNRNFEGRQGKGVRTHLMSPAMAAAAAVSGAIADVRKL